MTEKNISKMQRALRDFAMNIAVIFCFSDISEIQKQPGEGTEKLYFMLHMVTGFAEVGEGHCE